MNRKGVITVFLALVLPVMLAAFMLLSDAVVLETARHAVEKSAENAAYAVLGGYSSYLYDNYGIYACCILPGQAREKAGQSIERSLSAPGFFDFRVEDVRIAFSGNLAEEGVMEGIMDRIATDSLYRGAVEEFASRLDSISFASEASEVIRWKMKFDEAVAAIKESQTRLSSLVNGDGKSDSYVRFPAKSESFTEALGEFLSHLRKIEEVLGEMEELKEDLGDKDENAALRMTSLEEELGELRRQAAEIYKQGVGAMIESLEKVNARTIETLEGIFVEKVDIHRLSDILRDRVKAMGDCPKYIGIILDECIETLVQVEEAFTEQVFEEIGEICKSNLEYLRKTAISFKDSIENENYANVRIGEFPEEGYRSDIEYSYSSDENPGKGNDLRGFFEAMGKKVLEKKMGEDRKVPEGKELPSALARCGQSKSEGFPVETTGRSTKSADSHMDSFADDVKDVLKEAAGVFALNEYVLQHFRNGTTEEKTGGYGTYFKNEVEYILWGAKSGNTNVFLTKTALMGTRFALNAIHVYSDSAKRAKADAVAAATAGWWTAGAGVPVMSHLVKCAWAVAEAGLDVAELRNGGGVAVVKGKGDWVADIGISKAGPKTPEALRMDYEDYLRLYLLAVPERTKILRMLDLIDLNSDEGFSVGGAYTCITVEAVVSCRSLLGERHEIKTAVTKGY